MPQRHESLEPEARPGPCPPPDLSANEPAVSTRSLRRLGAPAPFTHMAQTWDQLATIVGPLENARNTPSLPLLSSWKHPPSACTCPSKHLSGSSV